MARGFGSTLGAGVTDNIALSLATTATQRSWSIWLNRNENETMRVWAKENSAGTVYQEILFYYTDGTLNFYRHWDGNSGVWTVTAPTVDTWAHILVTYDSSATANDAVVYVNGTSSATETSTPSGALTNTTDGFMLGNYRADTSGGLQWRGYLAEFAVWDTLLTQADATALSKGVSPLIVRRGSLVHYTPVWGRHAAEVNLLGAAGTVTGTAYATHPRLVGRSVSPSLFIASLARTQEGYRWRLDDANEAAATWAAAQDTGITAAANAVRRLRVLVDTTGDTDATQFQLEYKEANAANWTAVT